MGNKKVAVVSGDGIGKEVIPAALEVVHATGAAIDFTHFDWSAERYLNELVPANGVYITRMKLGTETFNAVTNIGVRPTFGVPSYSIESHLLDFHPVDITADTDIELCFLKRLRDEIKWPNVAALRAQIAKDVAQAQKYFRSLND